MSDERIEFKGSLFRGYTKWLEDKRHLEAVRDAASPFVRARLDDPPIATEWIASTMQNGLLDAVHAVGGDELVRTMIRGSIGGGVLKLLEPLIQGIVRVFGRTPVAILSRLESVRVNVVRGVRFEYEPTSASSGVVIARSLSEPFGEHSALAWASSIEAVCELVGFRSARTAFELSADRRVARIRVRW